MTVKTKEMDRRAARLLELQWKVDQDLHSEQDKAELNVLEADVDLLARSTIFAEEFHKKYHQKSGGESGSGDSRSEGEANLEMMVDIATGVALIALLAYFLGVATKAL